MTKLLLIILTALITYSFYSFFFIKYYDGKVSDHFDGIRFYDPEVGNNKNFWDVLKWYLTSTPAKWPDKVENNQFDVPPAKVEGKDIRVSYVGHMTFLIQTAGLNILTDPVWSDRVSPFSFAGPKRVINPGVKFEDLPPIDIVWISHNHYDHLDLTTIDLLWNKYKSRIITPLGNDKIIKSHNPNIKVETYDWGEQVKIDGSTKFHIEPVQHWSARGLLDKNKALWAALVIETLGGNIYFAGDTGYGNGRYFKETKEKFRDFRLALLPMGAYKPRWFMEYAHMDPEEMVRAHNNLGALHTIPCHFDVFKLSDEPRGEAILKLEQAKRNLHVGDNVKILEVGEFRFIPSE